MQTLPLAEMHQREWLLQNQPDRVTTLQFCLDLTICLSLSIKHTRMSHISVISTHVRISQLQILQVILMSPKQLIYISLDIKCQVKTDRKES